MRLLDTTSFALKQFAGSVPPYAILSHTWGDEEVTYQDIQDLDKARTKAEGLAKIDGACALARSGGHRYIWIDTCCIDQSSSAELSEAINSMFNWYRQSEICYAYLSDVTKAFFDGQNLDTKWCTRGWTLQELLAPSRVRFVDAAWQYLGTRKSLARALSRATRIDSTVLDVDRIDLQTRSIACRMSWMAHRKTTRVEDMAYSLLGIFDVNMPLLYGEGKRSFKRLQEEIMKFSADQSLFAWGLGSSPRLEFHAMMGNGVVDPLADQPSDFDGCGGISAVAKYNHADMVTEHTSVPVYGLSPTAPGIDGRMGEAYRMAGMDLQITLPLVHSDGDRYYGLLACQLQGRERFCIGVPLQKLPPSGTRYFSRTVLRPHGIASIENGGVEGPAIELIPIEDAVRAQVETVLIMSTGARLGKVPQWQAHTAHHIYHPFVAISHTPRANSFMKGPVAVLPSSARWDDDKGGVFLPDDKGDGYGWAALVYLLHKSNRLGSKEVSVVSLKVSMQTGMLGSIHANIVEVHPPRHLDAKSPREAWLQWAASAGIEDWANYRSLYWARLQNDPSCEIVAIPKKKRIYNHSFGIVEWDIRDWREAIWGAETGGYLRDGSVRDKIFHD